MKNLFLAVIGMVIFQGCATLNYPMVSMNTNLSFLKSSGGIKSVTIRNSAGPDVVLVPQSLGNGFVVKYKEGKRKMKRLLTLKHGESTTVRLYHSTGSRMTYAVYVPFAVLVIVRGEVLGSYSYCIAIHPGQDSYQEINFGRHQLREMKQDFTGYQCQNY